MWLSLSDGGAYMEHVHTYTTASPQACKRNASFGSLGVVKAAEETDSLMKTPKFRWGTSPHHTTAAHSELCH